MRKSQSSGRARAQAERARLVVEYRDPHALKPYARNARRHPPQQVERIRAAMERYGNNNPILLRDDEETIGAGHGRWEAALLEPALAEVPTIILRGLTDAEWRAYVIADNKLAEQGEWDEDMLAAEVAEILHAGEELDELLGFAGDELARLLADGDAAGGGTQGGGPQFRYQEQFGVIVVCKGEAEQQSVFEKLTGQGLECRVVVT